MRGYESRQATLDQCHQRFSDYIRGVDRYQNPNLTYPVALPSGYQEAWANGSGQYIMSNNSNFNPNQKSNVNWQRIRRVDN